jgi:UDP-N-acetylmuramate dehydrogenase
MTKTEQRSGRASTDVAAQPALDALAETLGSRADRGVALTHFTAMGVGGPADLLVVAESVDELVDVVGAARRHGVPWQVLGAGCNVLVADHGLRGLVIINRAASVSFDEHGVRADAGTKLAPLAQRTANRGMTGLVWANGLPGTVGGAVVGNAGAFDGDVAGTLRSATVLEPNGEIVERTNAWFAFEYRSSRLKRELGSGRVVLAATFALEPGDADALRTRADEVIRWRRNHHPLGATMGSTFKNPPGRYAGQLIDEAGLKGHRVGGAQVSEQHANFIVNTGDASAEDVLALIENIRAEVERRFDVGLDLEIELLGW